MAESDTKSIIVLTSGDSIKSGTDVETVRHQLGGAPEGDVSFMKIVDTRGQAHWVSVHQIVDIREPPEYGSTMFT